MKTGLLSVLLVTLPLCVHAQSIDSSVEREPDPDEFILVTQEPEPIVPIGQLVQYPDSARRAGIEGKVVVSALIEKNGSVSKVLLVRGAHPLLDTEAVRVYRSAKFTPGMDDGKPVRVWITQSINFKLQPALKPTGSPADTPR